MDYGTATVAFYDGAPVDADGLVADTLASCRAVGLSGADGSDGAVDPGALDVAPTDRLRLYDGDTELRFRLDAEATTPDPFLEITVAGEHLEPSGESDGEYTGFLRSFVELIEELAVAHDPSYGTAVSTRHVSSGVTPSEVMPQGTPIELERIPWLGVYGRSLVDRLGGLEHVRSAPAWRVETLENGSVMVIKSRIPWEDPGPDHPVDRHLLGASDRSTDRASGSESARMADPFEPLERGAYGAEAAVRRADIADEFRNEDLELVRVYVDEDRDLRRVEDDSFVRNVVTDDPDDRAAVVRRMLADVPADAAENDLMVSALVHEAIPPSFVRLDEPDGANVVTRVMNLDVDTNKVELLISLGRAAQHGDGMDVVTIESALDELAGLEDSDGVDRWIEQNLL